MKKLLLLLPILFASVGILHARYYCDNLCREQAQDLLRQGYTYLDGDSDGEACERSPHCGGGTQGYSATTVSRCPANSHSMGNGACQCDDGYISNTLSNSCEYDRHLHCSKKFPGTIYRASDKQCVCPGDKPMAWNSETKSCPVYDALCEKAFGFYSHATEDGSTCTCKAGYRFEGEGYNQTCVVDSAREDNTTAYNDYSDTYSEDSEDGSALLGLLTLGTLGTAGYFLFRPKKQ